MLEEDSAITCQHYDAVPWGFPTDIMSIIRWMTAGICTKKTMLTRSAVSNCQRDFFFSFCESWGRSMRDLWECWHVTSAVLLCAVICTKKTLLLLKTRAGSLSFNCKGFKHESSFPSSQRPSCHTLTLNATSSALHVLCNIAPSVLPEISIDNCVQVKLLPETISSKIYFPFKKIFWVFSNSGKASSMKSVSNQTCEPSTAIYLFGCC